MDDTAVTADPTADDGPSRPTVPQLIRVTREGDQLTVNIDGVPLPFEVAAASAAVEEFGPFAGVHLVLVAGRVEFANQPTVTQPEPEPVDVPPGIAALVAKIACEWPAITYHPLDPNRLAIEYAARRAGLVLCPSEGVTPRSVRGARPEGFGHGR